MLRFVAITDRRLMGEDPAAAIAQLAAPGVVVQVREKDLDGGPLFALVRAALATGAEVVVNDRLDVALAAGARGVHLPARGLSVADARRIAAGRAGFSVGVSCHSVEEVVAAAAAGADRVQLGPIWDTPGKGPALGVGALSAARAALPAEVALVAVGGITDVARARAAREAGADAVAAIRAAWSGALPLALLTAR